MYFGLLHGLAAVAVVLAALTLVVSALASALTVVVATLRAALAIVAALTVVAGGLTACLFDIYLFLACYTAAFLTVALGRGSALRAIVAAGIALVASLFFRFFLRTGGKVNGVEVDFSHDVERGSRLRALDSEYFGFCRSRSFGLGGFFLGGGRLRSLGLGLCWLGCRSLGSLSFRSRGLRSILNRGCGFRSLRLRSLRLGSGGFYGSCLGSFCLRFFNLRLCLGCGRLRSLGLGGFLRTAHHGVAVGVKLELAKNVGPGHGGGLHLFNRGGSRLGRSYGSGAHLAFLTFVAESGRTVLKVFVALESSHKEVYNLILYPGIGIVVDFDVFCAQNSITVGTDTLRSFATLLIFVFAIYCVGPFSKCGVTGSG